MSKNKLLAIPLFAVIALILLHKSPERPVGQHSDDVAEAPPPAATPETRAETAPTSSPQPDYADRGKQQAWIDLGENEIKKKLRDPDSATFRNVEFHSSGGVPIVCGEVNANNGFGGKGGFERFVAAGDKVDVLESEMASGELPPVWDRFCS